MSDTQVSKYQRIFERERDRGNKVSILDGEFELYKDLKIVWTLFTFLNNRRQTAFNGPQRSTIGEINKVLDMFLIDDPDERIEMFILLSILDNKYIELGTKND